VRAGAPGTRLVEVEDVLVRGPRPAPPAGLEAALELAEDPHPSSQVHVRMEQDPLQHVAALVLGLGSEAGVRYHS
jgi:hypothetical protein